MRLLLCLSLLLPAAAAPGAAPPARTPAEWLKLIDQLGDDDVDVRKEAAKKLTALGEDILPALRRAVKTHNDADVRLNGAVILAAIEKGAYGEVRRYGEGETTTVLAVSPDGKHLASGYFAMANVRVYDVKTGKLAFELQGHPRGVYGIAFSPDGKQIATTGSDGVLSFWDARTGKLTKKVTASTKPLYSVVFTPDSKKVAACSADGDKVRVWDVASGDQIAGNRQGNYIVNLAMLADGKHFVASGLGGEVWLLDVAKCGRVRQMTGGVPKYGYGVAASLKGGLVAAGGDNKTLRVWDATTGKLVKELTGHKASVRSVAFSPDGGRLISTSDDRTAIVWDLESGKILEKLEHGSNAIRAEFLPDGRHAVTSAHDRTLRLWRVREKP